MLSLDEVCVTLRAFAFTFLFLINTFVCDKYELHLYLIEFPLVIFLLHAFHGHSVDKVIQRYRACFKDFTFIVNVRVLEEE